MTTPTLLYPRGNIYIQKAGDVDLATGEATFFVLPIAGHKARPSKDSVVRPRTTAGLVPRAATGLIDQCEVEFATTQEGTAVTATFTIVNLHPSAMRQIAEEGYVRIEAGYDGHPTRGLQTVFYGRLSNHPYRIESGMVKWPCTAVAEATGVDALRPKLTLGTNKDGSVESATVGELIRRIADKIGLGRNNVFLPSIFDGDLTDCKITPRSDLPPIKSDTFKLAVTLTHWTTTDTCIEEIGKLIQFVVNAVRDHFGVQRRFGLLPNVQDPFRIVIQDLDLFEGEFMSVDLDSPLIMSAGPNLKNVSVPPTETDTGSTTATQNGATDAAPTNQPIEEFEVVSIFDPKVSNGLLIKGASKQLGISAQFRVNKGKHILNGSPLRWRTEYSGQTNTTVEVPRSAP